MNTHSETDPKLIQSQGNGRLKVMMVLTGLGRGGTETQVLRIARGLSSEIEFHIVALVSGGDLRQEFEAAGIVVSELGMKSGLRHPSNALGYAKLLKEVWGFNPDIIHGWLLDGSVAAVLAGRLTSRPVIVSKRGSNRMFSKLRILAERHSAKIADRVMTNSTELVKELEHTGVPTDSICLIPNGISVSGVIADTWQLPVGVDADSIVIGTVGRFVAEKRYDDILDSVEELLAEHPKLHLVLVGGRGTIEEYKAKVACKGISDRITFLGEVQNVYPVLSRIDIFVLASSQEGLPNAVMEAMTLSKPVVATRVGGIPDLVVDQSTGILVDAYSPQQLALAFRRLVADASLREKFGKAGRRRIEEFSVEKLLERVRGIYSDVLEG